MSFVLSRIFGPRVRDVLDIAHDYRELCSAQRDLIAHLQHEKVSQELQHSRALRSLIEQFLIVLDNPEYDIRDLLIASLSDFDDQIARLEEHV